MKTIKKINQTIVICFLLVFTIKTYSQEQINERVAFVRVFNLDGKKISKGAITNANDSALTLKRGEKLSEINISNIGFIKTKRSGGNNVLIGSLAGASVGAILGISTADPDAWFGYSATEGATAFGLLGAVGGAAIGGILSGTKNSETFIINGDINKWQIFKQLIKQ